MTFDEFCKKVESTGQRVKNKWGTLPLTPGVKCADGFTVSIQASNTHYCTPRFDLSFDSYAAYELGYPSENDDLIAAYADFPEKAPDTVYGYVPSGIVAALIDKHGGIVG